MRFGVLGTGMVGATIASKLIDLGHEVMMGSRSAESVAAANWVAAAGARARRGTFAQAARFGQALVNATAGAASLEALAHVDREDLVGKLLVDVANPLTFAYGSRPTLTVCNTDSLGERIQRTYPEARVVKTLNTLNAELMVNPGKVPGDHCVFVSGDDPAAKSEVGRLLEAFGWPAANIIDLGDITTARAAEMYLPLWVCLGQALGTGRFNISIQSGSTR
jgi:8-hydroxy-5-deazaflavin:NADPH oxidoreductase